MPITLSAQPFYVQLWFAGAQLPCSAAIAAENANEKRRRFLAVPPPSFNTLRDALEGKNGPGR
jgi:hypothetical protein